MPQHHLACVEDRADGVDLSMSPLRCRSVNPHQQPDPGSAMNTHGPSRIALCSSLGDDGRCGGCVALSCHPRTSPGLRRRRDLLAVSCRQPAFPRAARTLPLSQCSEPAGRPILHSPNPSSSWTPLPGPTLAAKCQWPSRCALSRRRERAGDALCCARRLWSRGHASLRSGPSTSAASSRRETCGCSPR